MCWDIELLAYLNSVRKRRGDKKGKWGWGWGLGLGWGPIGSKIADYSKGSSKTEGTENRERMQVFKSNRTHPISSIIHGCGVKW